MPAQDVTRVLSYTWQAAQITGRRSQALILMLNETGQATVAYSCSDGPGVVSLRECSVSVSAEQADAILVALAAALPWVSAAVPQQPLDAACEWCQLQTPSGEMLFEPTHPAKEALCCAMRTLIPSAVWQELGVTWA